MKAKELKKLLKSIPEDTEILVSSDEELNEIYTRFDLAFLTAAKQEESKKVVIYPLSGSQDPEYE